MTMICKKLPPKTRKSIGFSILFLLALLFAVAAANRYTELEVAATNYQKYQTQQADLNRKIEDAKVELRACLDAAKDDECVPRLRDLFEMTATPSLRWWYNASLWQSSNGAVNAANNDRLVRRAATYRFVEKVDPYLATNDPTRKKFHARLRQNLVDIDNGKIDFKPQIN